MTQILCSSINGTLNPCAICSQAVKRKGVEGCGAPHAICVAMRTTKFLPCSLSTLGSLLRSAMSISHHGLLTSIHAHPARPCKRMTVLQSPRKVTMNEAKIPPFQQVSTLLQSADRAILPLFYCIAVVVYCTLKHLHCQPANSQLSNIFLWHACRNICLHTCK